MIAKRINRLSNDKFRRLAEYIAGAKDPGEKLDKLWIVNAYAGKTLDDLDMAIDEIEATQGLNSRVKSEKSYHLVVSFRDEHPSLEALKDIEQEYAKALGFEEHQRVAATHQNTDNFHMHIAINKIHPATSKAHWPAYDFKKLEAVSRSMEKKYGLKVDLGREDKQEPDRKPEAARDMEAHTWEQSFHGYIDENKKALMKGVDEAKTWQDVHESFSEYDLKLRKRGNGLIITNGRGTQRVKASSVDRSLSKPALEKRFGPYEAQKRNTPPAKPKKTYKRRPITKMKGQSRLWNRYLGVRRNKETLTGKAFRTWRDYLMLGVIDDPLAMAIIHAQKKIIEGMTLQNLKPRPSKLPLMPSPLIDKPSPTPAAKDLKTSTPKNQDKITGTDVDMKMAEKMGAFWDTALTEKDVRESQADLKNDDRARDKPTKKNPKGPELDY